MSIFEHQRFEIFSGAQHPYKHTLADFGYSNPALGAEVTNLEQAMDWVMAVLYPSSKDAVDTTADLPAVGNSVNDMRVVLDDGDGKAATYRWEQREGDASPKWYKIYDMDWGYDSILSGFLLQTQDIYVSKYGRNDIDDAGNLLTGVDAGQHLYGGLAANSHLTLHANSGDGTGAQTGFVQFADNVRPVTDSAWSLGTTTERWLKVWTDELTVETMTISGGTITDSTGTIDFDDEDLVTTGDIAVGGLTVGTMVLGSGSITDTTGAIDFDDEDLTTTGTVAVGTLMFESGAITDALGSIDFDDEDLTTTGQMSAGVFVGGQLNVDNVQINGNEITATDGGDLLLTAATTGFVNVTKSMKTLGITATGVVGITGSLAVDNLSFDGNTLSSTDTDGSILLDPNGTGHVLVASTLNPDVDGSYDLGEVAKRWNKLFLDDAISDGTNEITIANLLTFRAVGTPGTGDTLFWDGAKWVASAPDSEIDHGALAGLSDDDHAQYVLLAGRASGQTLTGGSAAGDDLTLESTSDASKGSIFFSSVLAPTTDDTLDIGDASHRINDLFMTGEAHGLRLENFTTAGRPSASASNKGRVIWDTDVEDIYVDVGGSWRQITSEQYYEEDATNWNGSQTTVTYDVSGTVDFAKKMVWALKNNSDNYKQIGAEIDFPTNDTTVRVTVGIPLAAGTYTLVGR